MTQYDATGVCQECRGIKPRFDRIIAYGIYEGRLKELIHQMKFSQTKRLAHVLGREMTALEIPPHDCVIPVPLSIRGLRKREFNQSALMAVEIAKHRKKPLVLSGLIKIRETHPQSSLPRKDRVSNVRGAFLARAHVAEKNVLLVDDVVTTAATVNECAKVLKQTGAESVTVITAARAHHN